MTKVKQYAITQQKNKLSPEFNIYYDEKQLKTPDQNKKLIEETISAYQSTSYWLEKNQLNR
jgi:hypothetical protein